MMLHIFKKLYMNDKYMTNTYIKVGKINLKNIGRTDGIF